MLDILNFVSFVKCSVAACLGWMRAFTGLIELGALLGNWSYYSLQSVCGTLLIRVLSNLTGYQILQDSSDHNLVVCG
jgi:hypothetical protein